MSSSSHETKSVVIVGGDDVRFGKKKGTRKKTQNTDQKIILEKNEHINNVVSENKPEQPILIKPEIKVELKKKTPKLVSLKQRSNHRHEQPKQTKKKKIVLGVSSLKKRLTKSNKIKEKIKKMPIDTLRKELIARGIIKSSSKAPEQILRQIAIDSNIIGINLL